VSSEELQIFNLLFLCVSGIILLVAGFPKEIWTWVGIGMLLSNQVFLYSKLEEVRSLGE